MSSTGGDAPPPSPTARSPRRQPREVGERRWPMALAVLVSVVLQLSLPDRHIVQPSYIFPIAELGLLIVLMVGDPGRIDKRSAAQRWLTMILVLVMTIDNMLAVVELVVGVLDNSKKETATVLLATGTAVWITNVIVFSLWYWELDRGGPAARSVGGTTSPAFTFPEMQNGAHVPAGWMPSYVDYLFLAFTNATAFSPTDTAPLKSWAKLMMMVQAAVSVVTGIMIISRALNILN